MKEGGTMPAGYMDTMEELFAAENRCLIIWNSNARRIKFLLKSVYDVLPSPGKLFTRRKSGITSFPLCAGKTILRQIMCLSKGPGLLEVSLESWPCTWKGCRHGRCCNPCWQEPKLICFVKAGDKPALQCLNITLETGSWE